MASRSSEFGLCKNADYEVSTIGFGSKALGPVGHTAVSAAIGGGVWAATGSALAFPVAFSSGVLIDADHALDFYNLYVKKDRRRLFLLLHGWEYGILGLVLIAAGWHHPLLVAAVLGHLGHLTADQIDNRPVNVLAYFVAYRLYCRFDLKRLFGEPYPTLSEALHHSIPLWRIIEPRLLRVGDRLRRRDAGKSGPLR